MFLGTLSTNLRACPTKIKTGCANPDNRIFSSHFVSGGDLYNQLVNCKKACDTYR